MRIDSNLNLVIPIELQGSDAWIHATPISVDVFKKYFEPMAVALSTLYGNGALLMAPRVASLQLEKSAKKLGEWDGNDGVKNGLVGEINRLINVVLPGQQGWDSIPYNLACAKGMLAESDQVDIENIVVFFILVSAIHREQGLKLIEPSLAQWDARLESLTSTEFRDSLQTLIAEKNTAETA